MTYLQTLTLRKVDQLSIELEQLARVAVSCGLYIKTDVQVYRAATSREIRETGQTHILLQ
jgi:hypothetical protein